MDHSAMAAHTSTKAVFMSFSPALAPRNASKLAIMATTEINASAMCAWLDKSSRSYHLQKPTRGMPSARLRLRGLRAVMAGS